MTSFGRALWFSAILACATILADATQTPAAEQSNDRWLSIFSQELGQLDQERSQLILDLTALGAPVIGQTAPQFGYQHTRVSRPPLTPPPR